MRGRHTVLRKELFAQPARAGALDVVGPARSARQRRHRLVRRLSEPRGPRVDRRHHGVPVVHVPAAQSGLEHRQFVLGAAAIAGGDGARVRSARDGRRQARQTRMRVDAPHGRRRDSLRGRRVRVSRGPAGRARLQRRRARAASVVALVGRSGAGKTTVTDLVARFHDPTKGRILVNGTDIRDFSLQDVSRSARDRPAGRVSVRRIGARQHRLRPARRHRRGGRGRRAARQRARVHRQAARTATRRSSASAASSSRAASSSDWRSRARFWRRRRS